MQQFVFTREQIRQVDAEAVERFHMPGVVLMENAARGLALHALRMLGWPREPVTGQRVLIVCGGGNNGGDGFAAARHLHNAGAEVIVVHLKAIEDYGGDAKTNLAIARAMDLHLVPGGDDPVVTLNRLPRTDLLLDGVLGTGLRSAVRPPLDAVIGWLNEQPMPTLAIDIPSGLDSDTGEPLGSAVKAAATVTFVGAKRGFLRPQARDYVGDLSVCDIGVPRELVERLGTPVPAKPPMQ